MAKPRKQDFDVVLIGGGLAGMAMACILGRQKIRVAVIDKDDPCASLQAQYDGRTTAISSGSHSVLERAGVWDTLAHHGCPIRDIHITDNGSPVLLEFLSRDVGAQAFGWIFENRILRQALLRRAQGLPSVALIAPAEVRDIKAQEDYATVMSAQGDISCSLIIGADGRQSFVRERAGIETRSWPYRQRAIVCTVVHENPHDCIAVEDFRSEGPFAILPMADDTKGRHRSSIVWTEQERAANSSALHWDEDMFTAALNARFPARYGAVTAEGKRFSYPLGLIHAYRYTAPRIALIADAAHGIHPIAGQGLNLGYRDVAALSNLLITAQDAGGDMGARALLLAYQRARRADAITMAGATDMLNTLFGLSSPPVRTARIMGLKAVQAIAPARRFFMRQAMGVRKESV